MSEDDDREEWEIERDAPYFEILPRVQRLVETWGCELVSFNPSWTISKNGYVTQIPHEIMTSIIQTPSVEIIDGAGNDTGGDDLRIRLNWFPILTTTYTGIVSAEDPFVEYPPPAEVEKAKIEFARPPAAKIEYYVDSTNGPIIVDPTEIRPRGIVSICRMETEKGALHCSCKRCVAPDAILAIREVMNMLAGVSEAHDLAREVLDGMINFDSDNPQERCHDCGGHGVLSAFIVDGQPMCLWCINEHTNSGEAQ